VVVGWRGRGIGKGVDGAGRGGLERNENLAGARFGGRWGGRGVDNVSAVDDQFALGYHRDGVVRLPEPAAARVEELVVDHFPYRGLRSELAVTVLESHRRE